MIKTLEDIKNNGKFEQIINSIICGDVLEILRQFPDECIDMVITSPPYYGLRRYEAKSQWGLEPTFQEYLDKMIELMKEIKRVMKPTATCWINFGDCYGGSNNGANGYRPERTSISKNDKKYQGQKGRYLIGNHKCLLMQPERFAIRCIDEVGLILRNKIVWTKQVLVKKTSDILGEEMTLKKDLTSEQKQYVIKELVKHGLI